MNCYRCMSVLFLVLCIVFSCKAADKKKTSDFYSFEVTDVHGTSVSLEKFRGMITLVVNVASECGFTDRHYRGLVRIHRLLGDTEKFSVLAFPCNQFGGQEPKDNHDIFKFAQENYQVNFPLFAKLDVIDSTVHPAWKYLSDQSGQTPNWNFWKYLIDKDGKVIDAWGPWSDVEEIFPKVKHSVDALLQAQGPPKPPKGVAEDLRNLPGGNEVGMESGSDQEGSPAGSNPDGPNLAKVKGAKPPPPPPKDPAEGRKENVQVKPPPPPRSPGSQVNSQKLRHDDL